MKDQRITLLLSHALVACLFAFIGYIIGHRSEPAPQPASQPVASRTAPSAHESRSSTTTEEPDLTRADSRQASPEEARSADGGTTASEVEGRLLENVQKSEIQNEAPRRSPENREPRSADREIGSFTRSGITTRWVNGSPYQARVKNGVRVTVGVINKDMRPASLNTFVENKSGRPVTYLPSKTKVVGVTPTVKEKMKFWKRNKEEYRRETARVYGPEEWVARVAGFAGLKVSLAELSATMESQNAPQAHASSSTDWVGGDTYVTSYFYYPPSEAETHAYMARVNRAYEQVNDVETEGRIRVEQAKISVAKRHTLGHGEAVGGAVNFRGLGHNTKKLFVTLFVDDIPYEYEFSTE